MQHLDTASYTFGEHAYASMQIKRTKGKRILANDIYDSKVCGL